MLVKALLIHGPYIPIPEKVMFDQIVFYVFCHPPAGHSSILPNVTLTVDLAQGASHDLCPNSHVLTLKTA